MAIQERNTKQKDAIRTAFIGANRPLSPEEVFSSAKKKVKGISMATVYRNLSSLVAEAWLSTVDVPGASTRYEVAGKEHHHHFQCNACGKMFDLPGCGIDVKHKLPTGFRVTSHEFFLYGRCAACR